MSTPTVIRHYAFTEVDPDDSRVAMVISYWTGTEFNYVFQVYEVSRTTLRTSMVDSSPWSGQEGAINEFDNYCRG